MASCLAAPPKSLPSKYIPETVARVVCVNNMPNMFYVCRKYTSRLSLPLPAHPSFQYHIHILEHSIKLCEQALSWACCLQALFPPMLLKICYVLLLFLYAGCSHTKNVLSSPSLASITYSCFQSKYLSPLPEVLLHPLADFSDDCLAQYPVDTVIINVSHCFTFTNLFAWLSTK